MANNRNLIDYQGNQKDKKMNKILLTAPCGLDCFNCPSYEGNITEEYKTRISEFLKIPRDQTVTRKQKYSENGNRGTAKSGTRIQ